MKRGYIIYLAVLIPVLLIGFLIVRSMTMGPHERALRKLGETEREYREARDQLVLGVGDPTDAIVAFVTNPKRDTREREHALRVLQELPRHRPLPDIGAELVPLLDQGSPAFKAVVLETFEKIGSVAAAVADLFRTSTDTMLYLPAHRALKAANERLMKRIEQAMREDDTTRIDSCLALASGIPSGKGPLYTRIARFYNGRGDSLRAAEFMRRAGFVDTCWVIGPFDNSGSGTLTRPLGPENRPFSPRDTFHIDDETIARWVKASRIDGDGNLNYNNFFVKRCCSVGYLFTYIHAPEDRDALLYLAYNEPTAVWFYDSLIEREVVYRGAYGDEDLKQIHLNKGVNTLMVKSVQELHTWRVQARLTNMSGDAMSDVRLSWYDSDSK